MMALGFILPRNPPVHWLVLALIVILNYASLSGSIWDRLMLILSVMACRTSYRRGEVPSRGIVRTPPTAAVLLLFEAGGGGRHLALLPLLGRQPRARAGVGYGS